MTGDRWALPLLGVGVVAWIVALAGGDLGSQAVGVVATAGTALLAGWRARPWPLTAACVGTSTLLAVADQVAQPRCPGAAA